MEMVDMREDMTERTHKAKHLCQKYLTTVLKNKLETG